MKISTAINLSAITLFLVLALCCTSKSIQAADSPDLDKEFNRLARIEKEMKKIRTELNEASGSSDKPDRIYALLDLADLCKNSRMQSHDLSSIHAVSNIVKRKKKFSANEYSSLKKRTLYAIKDFSRRLAFTSSVAEKAKDKQLLKLSLKLKRSFSETLEQLTSIMKKIDS